METLEGPVRPVPVLAFALEKLPASRLLGHKAPGGLAGSGRLRKAFSGSLAASAKPHEASMELNEVVL